MDVKIYLEIPEGSTVKYERDEETGQLTVDRLLFTPMAFPVSYGLVADTKGQDGDPLDALVFLSQPVIPGVVVKCQVIGLLEMEDEAGIDHKIVCVPTAKIDPICGAWTSLDDVPAAKKDAIRHFFEHYKDLEPGKWVKLNQWQSKEVAEKLVSDSITK
jgi:inorganic pyrophosphatase